MIPIEGVTNVDVLAMELGCKVGKIPSTYLGLPLGAPCKLEVVWDEAVNKFPKDCRCRKGNIFLEEGDLC